MLNLYPLPAESAGLSPMKSFITIKEATLLTGKSEITIRRLIRHVLKHDYADAGQMIRQEKTSSGFVYTIDKDLLAQKHLLLPTPPTTQTPGHEHPLTSPVSTPGPSSAYVDGQPADQAEVHQATETPAQPEDQGSGRSPSHLRTHNPSSAYAGDQPLFKALATTIDVLKDQLTAKDHQLGVKDEQISALIKDRERSDVLLKNLQDGIYLLQRPEPANSPRPYAHHLDPQSRGARAPQAPWEAELVAEDPAVVQAQEVPAPSQAEGSRSAGEAEVGAGAPPAPQQTPPDNPSGPRPSVAAVPSDASHEGWEARQGARSIDRRQTGNKPANNKAPREADQHPAKAPPKPGQARAPERRGIEPREPAAKPRPSPWWRPW